MDKRKNVLTNIYNASYSKLNIKVSEKISDELLRMAGSYIKNHFGSTIYFDSFDMHAMEWIQRWLMKKDKKKFYNNAKNLYKRTSKDRDEEDESINEFIRLAECKYVIKLDDKTFCLVISKYEDIESNNRELMHHAVNGKIHNVVLYIFGVNHKKYMKEAYKYIVSHQPKRNGAQRVWKLNSKSNEYPICNWSVLRDFNSVIMDRENKEELIKYIDQWKNNSKLFAERGITYKTGILLYGEPGTGKTTIAKAIAARLKADILSIDMHAILDININNSFRNGIEDRPMVVLLEDIDCIVGHREDGTMTEKEKAALNKTLQLLDGLDSMSNVIFVATTNHFDHLDEALKRESRFDVKMKISTLNKELAIDMCNLFKVDYTKVLSDNDTIINPSKLQDKIIKHLLGVKNI